MSRQVAARWAHALGRGIARAFSVFLAICTAAFVLGMLTIAVLGHTVWDHNGTGRKPTPPGPTASISTPISWTFQGSTCSDGWPSRSIGRRGACSHHGGVVSLWISDGGTKARCRSVGLPRTAELLKEQLHRFGRVVC